MQTLQDTVCTDGSSRFTDGDRGRKTEWAMNPNFPTRRAISTLHPRKMVSSRGCSTQRLEVLESSPLLPPAAELADKFASIAGLADLTRSGTCLGGIQLFVHHFQQM